MPSLPPPERIEALRDLMDDESPRVQAAVVAEWRRLGPPAWEVLRAWERGRNRWLAAQARQVLEALGEFDPVRRLKDDLQAGPLDLEAGFLRLEQTLGGREDPEEISRAIDSMGARVRELTMLPASTWVRCRIVNRVLFHEFGLRAVVARPEHGLLAAAWRSRRATPVALSVLYVLVARRAGLDLDLVWLGSRWWVGLLSVRPPLLIDPVAQGAFRSLAQFREGAPGPVEPCAVTPVEALMAVCHQWSEAFRRAGDHRRGLLYRKLELACLEALALDSIRRRGLDRES